MNSSKRGLGKGLSALLPDYEAEAREESTIKNIPLDEIQPNPYQPRKDFDQEKLKELADSIREHGVVQPVILAPGNDGKYIIIAGERRWRAARMAGFESVPALIKETDEKTLLQIALIENLQRDDLNPIEEANAYKKLIDDFQLTQEELAKRLGKNRTTIANTLRLLNLPPKVKSAILEGKITEGQARPLLGEKDEKIQQKIADEVIRQRLTARQVEKMVSKKEKEKSAEKEEENEIQAANELFTHEVKEELQARLGTKVKIQKKKNRGFIEIEFYSEEDLDRVASLITGRSEKES